MSQQDVGFFIRLRFMDTGDTKQLLKVALIQTELYWKQKDANRAMFEELIENLGQQVDMIILPEMFTTGFTMEAEEVAEPTNFHTLKWMKQIAAQKQALVTGSIVVKEGENYFNRLLWAYPDGNFGYYDKRHLFRMADEDAHYTMGKERVIFEWKGWKILPQVCYDLRFPVWSRNNVDEDKLTYDFVYYVANWPAPRVSAWNILLQARAVENLAYAAGVNRIGKDGNRVTYVGSSAAYNFKGEVLGLCNDEDKSIIVTLDKAALTQYREKFPAWLDSDDFSIHVK